MIIQVKSSYSDASSHVLEENQELYICHAPGTLADEKHAYIQKVADAYAVARMYLEHGKLHLVPIATTENVLLQNRPFTSEVVLGHGNLLQITECLLVFEVYDQMVTIMMGLVPGYRNAPQKKIIKVAGATTPTPSRSITPISVAPVKPKNSQRHPSDIPQAADHVKKTPSVSMPQMQAVVKQAEDQELSETDVLQSESSTTTVNQGTEKSVVGKEVTLKISKEMLMAIAAGAMVVLIAVIWFVTKGKTEAPASTSGHVAENNPSVASGISKSFSGNDQQIVSEEGNGHPTTFSSSKPMETRPQKASIESNDSIEKRNDEAGTSGRSSSDKKNQEVTRTNTMVTVSKQKTGVLSENVKQLVQSDGGVGESNVLSQRKDPLEEELNIAKKQYVEESKAFEEKLNNRLDNNQVYVQLWKVFREMRPSEDGWKTADDYRQGGRFYKTLEGDLVLAVKITALKQENEKAEKEQLLDEIGNKIEAQKRIMLENARKAKLEQDLDTAGVDKAFDSLSMTVEDAIAEVSNLEEEIVKIANEGRGGRHLVLIRADAKELKENWSKRKAALQNIGKDVAEIHEFEKLLKGGLEIRRQSERLTSIYNTLNAGGTVDFKMIDDAYQLLVKSYAEIKAIGGLPADVWKLVQERKEVEDNFYKEAKEVLNEK